MTVKSDAIVVAYIPVLHQGYLDFLRSQAQQRPLYLLGAPITSQFRPLVKDIRAIDPELLATAITSLKIAKRVTVLDQDSLKELAARTADLEIIMPDEQLMHQLAAEYFPRQKKSWYSVFLRWDSQKSTSNQPIQSDQVVSSEAFDRQLMQQATQEAQHSADWWRQVGAILVSPAGTVIATAYNQHLPSEQQPYSDGDPRADFHKGDHIELSTAIHAEAAAIAQAAKRGDATERCSLYVTTFPCPVCAKLIAAAGISTVYFSEGYAVLDGQTVLAAHGVKLVRVE